MDAELPQLYREASAAIKRLVKENLALTAEVARLRELNDSMVAIVKDREGEIDRLASEVLAGQKTLPI